MGRAIVCFVDHKTAFGDTQRILYLTSELQSFSLKLESGLPGPACSNAKFFALGRPIGQRDFDWLAGCKALGDQVLEEARGHRHFALWHQFSDCAELPVGQGAVVRLVRGQTVALRCRGRCHAT